MNTLGLLYILITSTCIYIFNQIEVYKVNRETNMNIDLEKFNFNEFLLGFVLINMSKNPVEKSIIKKK